MFKLKFPDKEIHTISLGAPKVFDPKSVSQFNTEFFVNNGGKFTLTRIESVKPNGQSDLVTLIPSSMAHPGWGSKTQTLDYLRSQQGISPDGKNTRNNLSWPFQERMDLWKPENKGQLDQLVQNVIGEKVIVPPPQPEQDIGLPDPTNPTIQGGSTYYRVSTLKSTVSSHMNYFGIGFWGTQRLAGMGNPAKTSIVGSRNAENSDPNVNKTFVANIFQECTKYKYVPWKGTGSLISGVTGMLKGAVKETGTNIQKGVAAVHNKIVGARRRTRRKRNLRKTKRSSR
jgi:hypothetical protein